MVAIKERDVPGRLLWDIVSVSVSAGGSPDGDIIQDAEYLGQNGT